MHEKTNVENRNEKIQISQLKYLTQLKSNSIIET